MRIAEPPMSKEEVEAKWRSMFYFDENAAMSYALEAGEIGVNFIIRGSKHTVVMPATVPREEKDDFLEVVRIAAIAYNARSVTMVGLARVLRLTEEMTEEEAARRMAAADPADLIDVLSLSMDWQDRGYTGSIFTIRPITKNAEGKVISIGDAEPFKPEDVAGDSRIRFLPMRHYTPAQRAKALRTLETLGAKISNSHFVHKAGHA